MVGFPHCQLRCMPHGGRPMVAPTVPLRRVSARNTRASGIYPPPYRVPVRAEQASLFPTEGIQCPSAQASAVHVHCRGGIHSALVFLAAAAARNTATIPAVISAQLEGGMNPAPTDANIHPRLMQSRLRAANGRPYGAFVWFVSEELEGGIYPAPTDGMRHLSAYVPRTGACGTGKPVPYGVANGSHSP